MSDPLSDYERILALCDLVQLTSFEGYENARESNDEQAQVGFLHTTLAALNIKSQVLGEIRFGPQRTRTNFVNRPGQPPLIEVEVEVEQEFKIRVHPGHLQGALIIVRI